jgi:hypothetical protein
MQDFKFLPLCRKVFTLLKRRMLSVVFYQHSLRNIPEKRKPVRYSVSDLAARWRYSEGGLHCAIDMCVYSFVSHPFVYWTLKELTEITEFYHVSVHQWLSCLWHSPNVDPLSVLMITRDPFCITSQNEVFCFILHHIYYRTDKKFHLYLDSACLSLWTVGLTLLFIFSQVK